MDIVDLELPRWAHRLGNGAEPDRAPLEDAKALVPARFDRFVPADHPAFRYGLTLHDNGFFWEAHEIWEAVWKAAPMNGPDRLAVRALIQIANAGLKRRMGRDRAAERLIGEARGIFRELPARGTGTEPSVAGRLRIGAVEEQLRRFEAGAQVQLGPMLLPERSKSA